MYTMQHYLHNNHAGHPSTQMATCLRSLDPAERENARQYVRALSDAQPAEEQASASTKESDTTKKRRKR